MNRRELFAVGGAGVVGLLFPQKVEAVTVRPVLEGLTDLEMAQKIAKFPQGPGAYFETSAKEITKPWGPPFLRQVWRVVLRERSWDNIVHSTWTIDGVKVKNTVFFSSAFDPRTEIIDISSLQEVYLYYSHPSRMRIGHQYSRLAVDGGFGWFTLHRSS